MPLGEGFANDSECQMKSTLELELLRGAMAAHPQREHCSEGYEPSFVMIVLSLLFLIAANNSFS